MACCEWGSAFPAPWQHAAFWAGNYATHPDYDVVQNPVPGSIGCRLATDTNQWGHVAYVQEVSGNNVTVYEQSCCEGASCLPNCSWCYNGFETSVDSASYYTGGYIVSAGSANVCGNGKCKGSENCDNCPKDCGECEKCGDGTCSGSESCGDCPQDCGGCCGNGQCDNGETCESCPKDCGCCGNGACEPSENCESCSADCGPCNQSPVGAVELLSCQRVSGWAVDPDTEQPIGVKLVAEGTVIAQVAAELAHPEHPGHGFEFSAVVLPLTDQPITLEVVAIDHLGQLETALPGSAEVVHCQSGVVQRGIWQVTYAGAAGLDILPIMSDTSPWTALKLHHPPSLQYPLSGQVTAQALISLSPFDGIRARLCGGFASPFYEALLMVDELPVATLGQAVQDCSPAHYPVVGSTAAFSLAALAAQIDEAERYCTLQDLSFGSRGWRFGYSSSAAGVLWGNEAVDRLEFASRTAADSCVGFVAAQRDFQEAYEGVEFQLSGVQPPGTLVRLLNEADEIAAVAQCPEPEGCSFKASGQRLEVQLDCGEGAAVPTAFSRIVNSLRVYRSVDRREEPWRLKGDKSWGISAQIPAVSTPGLALTLVAGSADFVPFGSLQADYDIALPQATEVRGMLSSGFPDQCLQGTITMDEVPVQTTGMGSTFAPFVVTSPGSRFGLGLSVKNGCAPQPGDAHLQVTNVSFKREGWWTSPSPRVAGIRDLRGEGCGLKFEHLKWWGSAANPSFGSVLTHRYLAEPHTGIRFKLEHDFAGPFFGLELLLDNEVVKQFSLQTPNSADEQLDGQSFTEVGFRLSVLTEGPYAYQWEAAIDDIEVLGPDGWVAVCSAQEGEPQLEGIQEPAIATVDNAVDVVSVDQIEPEKSPAGGCAAGPASGAGLGLLVLLLSLLGLRFRGRNRCR